MARANHDAAIAKGIKIVPCCAANSVAADITTWLAASQLQHFHGQQLGQVVSLVMAHTGGGISGGTMETFMGMIKLPSKEMAEVS